MSDNRSESGTQNDAQETYPTQRHAGQVGYGPNYHTGPTLADKLAGYKEELHGKIARKPELVKEGHDQVTGEAKRRQMLGLDEKSPFGVAQQTQTQTPQPEPHQTGDFSQGPESDFIHVKPSAPSKGMERGTPSQGTERGTPSQGMERGTNASEDDSRLV